MAAAAARLALAWISRPRQAPRVQAIVCVHCNARDSRGALCDECNEPLCADCRHTVARCQLCQRRDQLRGAPADGRCTHRGPPCRTCLQCTEECEQCEEDGACFCGDCGRRYDPARINYCRHLRHAPRLCQRCVDACEACVYSAQRRMYNPRDVSDEDEDDTDESEDDDNEAVPGSENDDPNMQQ